MRCFGVICEFNPFHNGHKYLLDNMRKEGGECIVAVMSGSFTQRGDVAIYPKHKRAKDALMSGADVVIELPTVWAVASAQRFATGGCSILKALGCIDRIYFGSECGDITLLKNALDSTENDKVNARLSQLMNQGEYYPSALEQAVGEIFGKDIADVIKNPNNTLGIEYMRALKDSTISAHTIRRTGVNHDSDITEGAYASASKIRQLISQSGDISDFVPYTDSCDANPALYKYGERAVIHRLRTLAPEELSLIPDVSEGLENRISEAASKYSSIEKILAEIKTKRYTHARLRRIITCAMLSVTKEHQNCTVPYIRVLGFNSRGEEFIRGLKSTCSLPVILNVASGYRELDKEAREIFDIDIRATDTRTIFQRDITGCGSDFTTPIVRIP